MHFLSAARKRIVLDLVPTSFVSDVDGPTVNVASETGSRIVNSGARAFFEMGRQPGIARKAATPAAPAPAVFRDRRSGLLRMVYREAVIRFRRGTPERRRRQILARHGYKVRGRNAFVPDQLVVYQAQDRRLGVKILEAVNSWAEMDEVVFATPNFVSQFRREAPWIHPEQWHLRNTARATGQVAGEDVKAREAWKVSRGKRSIVVAVLDDGVDVDHPGLRSRIRRNPDPAEPRDLCGRDFFLPPDHPGHFDPRPKRFQYPYDQMRGNDIHGTPCAGVIAATGRSRGAVGVAPGCRILPVKIFHADDLASDARVADAIRYAALHADVLSCSWSSPVSPDVELAIEDAGVLGRGGRGVAVFCATGNEDGSPVAFPASHPEAIAVGASTDRRRLASYSNVGPEVCVVAPSSGGVLGIFTTDVSAPARGFNTGSAGAGGANGLHTNDFGGTSSATPLAAGVGALALSVNGDLDRGELRSVLAETADKIGTGYDAAGHSDRYGFGRVNAAAAVEKARTP